MPVAAWLMAIALASMAQGQPVAQKTSSAHDKPTAVRVFDEDTMADVTGHLAFAGSAQPSQAAPQSLTTPPSKTEGNAQPSPAASGEPAKPEELDKLRAREQSLQSTLTKINDDIAKSQDSGRRETLEMMRSNVEMHLAEVRDAISAAQMQNAPKPPAGPTEPESKPAAEDHPPY